jgi:hypothetical protein
MGWVKQVFTDFVTVITATFLNGLQDQIIQDESTLADKVDKVAGKGLSTNDYTDAEKTKLAGVAAGAEVNVQSDWNAQSGAAQILNKPGNATSGAAGLMSAADKGKLDGLNAGNVAYDPTDTYTDGTVGKELGDLADDILGISADIAGVESAMTATKNYSKGDLLIAAGDLYKAAADIAYGATLTPDTNVTATTVAAELAALTNSKVDKSDWIVNEPGLFLLSKILCPDYSVTTNGRKLSKKFNHMKHEYVSSSSVARTLFFTGTEYSSQSKSPSQVSTIELKNLVPVTMLDVKNGQLYFEAYAVSDYTGSVTSTFHIMYCSVDENDAVTILSKVSLMSPVAKNVFAISPSPIEVPSGATHFALGQYSAGAGPAFEAVINIKIVPTE